MVEPPYTIFHKDRVTSRAQLKFLPKVVSALYLTQAIQLPIFFTKPHTNKGEMKLNTLDVLGALPLFTVRTKTVPFRMSPRLLVADADRVRDQVTLIPIQSIWIVL